MTINLQKEGAEIRALWERADNLEGAAATKTAEADDCRWEAARRTAEAFEAGGLSQRAFAAQIDQPQARVTEMVRVWQKTANSTCSGERPLYWEAVWMASEKDIEGLKERALGQGRKPSTVRQSELKTSHTLQLESSAKAVMSNPVVREAARRAIIAAEAEEARMQLMATANPVDIPVEQPGFNWLEADATLSRARQLINSVSRTVREHGPLTDADAEMLTDTARQVEIALEILTAVVKAGDLDDAFARMLDREV